jgi:hypothetical protein
MLKDTPSKELAIAKPEAPMAEINKPVRIPFLYPMLFSKSVLRRYELIYNKSDP